MVKRLDKTIKMDPQISTYCDLDRAASTYLANHLKGRSRHQV